MQMPDAVHRSRLNDYEFSLSDAPLADGGVLLTVTGELDVATVPAVRERLTAVTDAGRRRIVLDLRAVSFMDSTALAAFIHTKLRLGEDGHITLVISPDSYARLIFEVAGLDGVLDVVETLHDARP